MTHIARDDSPFYLTAVVLFLAIGLATVFPDAAPGSALAQSAAPAPLIFAGHTRLRGGDSSFMIGLVQVDLYCSASADDLGEKIAGTQSDYLGVYELAIPRTCAYYNLVAVPPQGNAAHMVETVGGKVINDSWIQYPEPLQGKELGHNEFWMLADYMLMITPTPSPARTPRPAPTPTETFSAPLSATPSAPAATSSGLSILEYIVGVVAASGVMLAIRRAIQARRRKD